MRAFHLVKAWVFTLLVLTLPGVAWPNLPDWQSQAPELRLVGASKFSYWGLDIYEASLWAEPGFRPQSLGQQSVALELRYLRALKGAAIAQRSLDEMRRIGEFTDAQGERWLALMQQAFPDVKSGDRLTGLFRPGQGVRFLANGRTTLEVPDPEFARLFFGIWLSEKTSQPKLRQALLGTSVVASP